MDLSKYSPDWKGIIRPAILKRDNYRCRVCGVLHKSRVYKLTRAGYRELDAFQEEWAKSTGRHVFTIYLVVAHIDQNKANNDPKNLLTLCPFHHAKFDAKSKTLSRKIKFNQANFVTVPALPPVLDERNSLLKEIVKSVKELTDYTITKSEAEDIYTLIIKFLQNEI